MRRLAACLLVSVLLALPVGGRAASAQSTETVPAQDTILGTDYGTAALVTAAVLAGAVAINAVVAPNLGTALGVLYVGHLAVEAALVFTGAGAGWSLGLWGGDSPTNVGAAPN